MSELDHPRLLLASLALVFLLPLAGYALLGTCLRYEGDDFFFPSSVEEHGYWGAQISAFENKLARPASNLVRATAALLGPGITPFLPFALITGLLLSWWWAFSRSPLREANGSLPTLLPAAVVAYLIVDSAPNRFQTLFSQTGMLTYLVPLLAPPILLGLAWAAARRADSRGLLPTWLLAAIVAFLAGGCNELVAVLQTCALVAVLAILLVVGSPGAREFRACLKALCAALLGSILSLAVAYFGAGTTQRMQSIGATEVQWLSVFDRARLDGFYYLKFMLLTWPVHLALLLLLSLVLGVALGKKRERGRAVAAWKPWLVGLGALASAGLSTVVAFAVGYYGLRHSPPARALVDLQALVLLAGMAAAVAVGMAVKIPARAVRFARPAAWAAIAMLAILGPIASTLDILASLRPAREYARFWDARDEAVRRLAGEGHLDLVAPVRPAMRGMERLAEPRWNLIEPLVERGVLVPQWLSKSRRFRGVKLATEREHDWRQPMVPVLVAYYGLRHLELSDRVSSVTPLPQPLR